MSISYHYLDFLTKGVILTKKPDAFLSHFFCCGCFAICIVIAVLFFGMMWALDTPIEYYETNDINEYGIYLGNRNNHVPAEFISSFFPEHIEEYYSEISYSYRAENCDTYGFEAYLEFTIEDDELFSQHTKAATGNLSCYPFQYDSDYVEYVVSNKLQLNTIDYSGEVYIEQASIGLILLSPENHKIVYIAIGVYDGGGVTVDSLCSFFERFTIDPLIYELNLTNDENLITDGGA